MVLPRLLYPADGPVAGHAARATGALGGNSLPAGSPPAAGIVSVYNNSYIVADEQANIYLLDQDGVPLWKWDFTPDPQFASFQINSITHVSDGGFIMTGTATRHSLRGSGRQLHHFAHTQQKIHAEPNTQEH